MRLIMNHIIIIYVFLFSYVAAKELKVITTDQPSKSKLSIKSEAKTKKTTVKRNLRNNPKEIPETQQTQKLEAQANGNESQDGCWDVKNWHDSDGEEYDCEWYSIVELPGEDRCESHGFFFENFGFTASTACCACGGGTCVDVPNWYDSDGQKYNCEWYSIVELPGEDRCESHGSFFENFGYTASNACCICGGGSPLDIAMAEDEIKQDDGDDSLLVCNRMQAIVDDIDDTNSRRKFVYYSPQSKEFFLHEDFGDTLHAKENKVQNKYWSEFYFDYQEDGSYKIKSNASNNGIYLFYYYQRYQGVARQYNIIKFEEEETREAEINRTDQFYFEYQPDDSTYKIRVKENDDNRDKRRHLYDYLYFHDRSIDQDYSFNNTSPSYETYYNDEYKSNMRFNLVSCDNYDNVNNGEENYMLIFPPSSQEIDDASSQDEIEIPTTCQSQGMLPITSQNKCWNAVESLGYEIKNVNEDGVEDIEIQGCFYDHSVQEILVQNDALFPCTEDLPCICETVFYNYMNISNIEGSSYECQSLYYQQSTFNECFFLYFSFYDTNTFIDVWQRCLNDGSDKCKGIIWKSCDDYNEGVDKFTLKKGAWKLIDAKEYDEQIESVVMTRENNLSMKNNSTTSTMKIEKASRNNDSDGMQIICSDDSDIFQMRGDWGVYLVSTTEEQDSIIETEEEEDEDEEEGSSPVVEEIQIEETSPIVEEIQVEEDEGVKENDNIIIDTDVDCSINSQNWLQNQGGILGQTMKINTEGYLNKISVWIRRHESIEDDDKESSDVSYTLYVYEGAFDQLLATSVNTITLSLEEEFNNGGSTGSSISKANFHDFLFVDEDYDHHIYFQKGKEYSWTLDIQPSIGTTLFAPCRSSDQESAYDEGEGLWISSSSSQLGDFDNSFRLYLYKIG